MGNACSDPGTSVEEAIALERNRSIDQQLQQERRRFQQEIKLLLLGAGESGKSTIAKQIMLIHVRGFSLTERTTHRAFIYRTILETLRTLLTHLSTFSLEVQPENKTIATLLRVNDGTIFNKQIFDAAKTLWADPALKEVALRSNGQHFSISDSATYFLDEIERISQPDYVPTEVDLLRVRTRTTGINESKFDLNNVPFRLVDVGGQRNERRKWISCFQDVTAVLFCVALSEFDMVLEEDKTTNRMHESLKLFGEVMSERWLLGASVILFLNKTDLFKEKVRRSDLRVCFPNYEGGSDYDKGVEYIKEKFLAKATSPSGGNNNPSEASNPGAPPRQATGSSRQVYTHLTCAIDTENVRFVFNCVKDLLLSQTLKRAGFPY